MGATQEDLQFKHWCPYCDAMSQWEWITIHDDFPKCTDCGWEPNVTDWFPKGLDKETGELLNGLIEK